MAVDIFELVAAVDEYLHAAEFNDYCPNGLQVEASRRVNKIVTGVTASQALIERAVAEGADALLVHHGYFWKGEDQPITGMKAKRIGSLMRNKLSLIAYHLPLDAHALVGNNQQLAQVMGWQVTGAMQADKHPLGLVGTLSQPVTAEQFSQDLAQKLQHQPLYLAGHQRPIQKLAWCTGAAQGGLVRAAQLGVDAYISGEVSEQTLHQAQELGISYFAAGHHATERYGVKALGDWIAAKWPIECQFIDLPNPV